MPTRQRGLKAVGDELEFKSFDERLAEAEKIAVPYKLPVSAEETLEFPCPTGGDLVSLASAQAVQDLAGMAAAVFGDQAARVLELTAGKPFVVLVKLVNDLMSFYNLAVQDLPES